MAERLTKKISKTIQDKYSLGQYLYYDFAGLDDTNKLLNKLGKLEDILEKYGIESVEELECFLDDYSKNQGRYFAICEEMDDLKKDRDAWKRACELACENMKLPVDILIGNKEFNECHSIVDYFYQQAKKEKESESK